MYLNCHTYFSFKFGTLSEKDLFTEAKEKGIHKLILTDINNTSAWVELARICEENKDLHLLDLAVGIEFRHDNNLLYIGLAKNNAGFEELNRFLSHHECENIALPILAPEFQNVYIIYPFLKAPERPLRSYEFIGIRAKELNKLYTSVLKDKLEKFVILHPVTVKNKRNHDLHRLLRAIDKNTLLSKLTPDDFCDPEECMLAEEELLYKYRHYPQIIDNTKRLLADCHFEIKLRESKNKKNFHELQGKDHFELKKLAVEGLYRRYKNNHKEAEKRIESELNIIASQHFESYFLISHDIVRYAKERGFAHVGRGSGANSIVSYCLGITDVDPIELDLYFERFLNPHRSSPPDFDIDFSWKDRDAIIDYILKKYEHSALLASFATFQGRAPIRELGKVFGLPKSEIDEIVEHPARNHSRDQIAKWIFYYGSLLKDFPKNLSIHAGGILISEEPLFRYTALNLPPKGFRTVHLDMYGAEDLGLYKYDILSQRGLGHIKDSVEIIKKK
ncbi:MAG TPA: PHP domain-containing protein [Cytophagales bacterium]|nr:PHP domain-containing protein [Cytophagales bacterium]